MGNCQSDPEAKLNKALQKQNKADHDAEAQKIKLLLLGAGESGKSAMFKQIKLLYGSPLNNEELSYWKQVIHTNVVEVMKAICGAVELVGMESEVGLMDDVRLVLALENRASLSSPMEGDPSRTKGEVIEGLWKDKGIQKVWERRSQFQVVDSHRVFLNEIRRLMDHSYVPTPQDTVLARVRTTGIVVDHFMLEKVPFALYDVGGQRSERRKWIHVFDNVNAIIFVVGLSEYDQMCFEDTEKNRMEEGLEVFEWITGHQLFRRTPIILFLNKADLFSEKIVSSPIAQVPMWSDFDGGTEYEPGWQYFLSKFTAIYEQKNAERNEEKPLYVHVTNATDPSNVEVVFNAAKDVVLRANLDEAGLG